MSNKYFQRLNYSLGDEDPSVEWRFCETQRPRALAVIAGSGVRVLSLLAAAPQRMYCLDVSPAQLALAELRVAAIKQLDFEEYCGLFGYPAATVSPKVRETCFEKVGLGASSKSILRAILQRAKWKEIIYIGEFERTLIKMSALFRLLLGRQIDGLFECASLTEQRDFVERQLSKRRWNVLVSILGNATTLNALLYKGAFPKINIGGSVPKYFSKVFMNLFATVHCRRSFFLQLLLLGKVTYSDGVPFEAQPQMFERIKTNVGLCDVRFICGNVMQLQQSLESKLDFVALSDVPSFFDDDEERMFLQILRSTLDRGGVIGTRGALRVARPDTTGFEDVTNGFRSDIEQETTQLWHINLYRATV